MADKVVTYAEKSLAHHIDEAVTAFDKVYVITPEFNWNRKPDPANPSNNTLPRALPFAGIVGMNDSTPPYTVGNILYEQIISVHVHVCGSTYTQMKELTSDMKQSLKTAVNPITNNVGIVLYNFAIASGSFFANAGTMRVEVGQTEYFGPTDESEEDNRKHKSITPVMLSAYKDSTATLLENAGRLRFNDN